MATKLLLNSDSLKTLLGAGGSRKKANRVATQEMVNSILMQETGLIQRKMRRTDVTKRKRRKKKVSSFETISSRTGLDRAHAMLLQHNNIYEYADLLDIPRKDVEVLERQFAECSRQARLLESQISAVNEQLTGGAAEISVVDLNLILESTGLGGEEAGRIVSDAISGLEQDSRHEETDGESTMPRLSLRGITILSSNHVIKAGMVQALQSRYSSDNAFQSSGVAADSFLFSQDDGMETDHLISQASATAPTIFRPSSNPELSQLSKMSSVMHSQTDRGLPPLRILKSHSSRPSRPKKRLLEAAGFDEALTRETPRVLHYGNSVEEHDPMGQVEALRRELQVSKAGLNQLTKMVDNNIAWVQQNCDMTQWSSHISARAKRKCRVMAVDRITRVFVAYLHRTYRWTIQQWHRAIQFDRFRGVVSKFCKAKAVVFITKALASWHLRRLYRRWTCWVQLVRVQRAVEREAACVEIQRVMRGCLGRRRVKNIRLDKAATAVQCLFRKIHAGSVVRRLKEQREQQISNEAALRIQTKLQEMLQVQKAKAELQRRKSHRAAIRIQKIYRGQQGREQFLRKQAEEVERKKAVAAMAATAPPATMQGSDLEALASQFRPPDSAEPVVDPVETFHDQAEPMAEATAAHAGKGSHRATDEAASNRKPKGKKAAASTRQHKRPAGGKSTHTEPLQSAATTIQKVARGRIVRSLSNKKIMAASTPPSAERAVSEAAEASAPEPAATAAPVAVPAEAPQATETTMGTEMDGSESAVRSQATDQQAQEGADASLAPAMETSMGTIPGDAVSTEPTVPLALSLEPQPAAAEATEGDEAGSLAGSIGDDSVTRAVNNVLDALSIPNEGSPSRAMDPTTRSMASSSPVPEGKDGSGAGESPPKRGMFNISLPTMPVAIKGSFFKNPFGSFSRKSIDPASAHASSTHGFRPIETIPDVDSPHANASRDMQDEAAFPIDEDHLEELTSAVERIEEVKAVQQATASTAPLEEEAPCDGVQFGQELVSEMGPSVADSLPPAASSDGASIAEAAVEVTEGDDSTSCPPEDLIEKAADFEEADALSIADVDAAAVGAAAKSGGSKPAPTADKRMPKPAEAKRPAADRSKAGAAATREAEEKRAKAKQREGKEPKDTKPKPRDAKASTQGKGSRRSMDSSSSHLSSSKAASKPSRVAKHTRESAIKSVVDEGVDADNEEEIDTAAVVEEMARVFENESSATANVAPVVAEAGGISAEEKPAENNDILADAKDAVPAPTHVQVVPVDNAALRVQKMARSHLARRKIDSKRQEVIQAQKEAAEVLEWATVTIQRGIRGKLGRKRFRVVYERKQAEFERKRQTSAAKIQSRMRGVHDRRRVAQLRAVKEDEERKIAWLKSYQKKKSTVAAAAGTAQEAKAEEGEEVEGGQPSSSGLAAVQEEGDTPPMDLDLLKGTFSSNRESAGRRSASSSTSRKFDRGGRPHTPGAQPAPPSVPRTPLSTRSSSSAKTGHSPDGMTTSFRQPPSGKAPHPNEHLGTPHPPPERPDPRLDGLEERLRQLEEVEKRIKESEQNLVEEAKKAEERIQAQIKLLEEKAKQADAERLAREELLKLAVGPMSHRSPFTTLGPHSSRMHATGGAMAMMMMSTRGSAPPTARSAKSGPIPANAPRLIYNGHEWVQLWDDEQQAYYWWCPMTQVAQWEQPGMETYYQAYYSQQAAQPTTEAVPADDSGYESSGGALTDYSTDHEVSYFSESEGGGHDDWQEYWDEQACAKYWYNNATGEASWTKPAHLESQASSRAVTAASYTTSETPLPDAQGQDNHGWISYIDEETGQLYWHNVATGEVRWDY